MDSSGSWEMERREAETPGWWSISLETNFGLLGAAVPMTCAAAPRRAGGWRSSRKETIVEMPPRERRSGGLGG